VGSAARRWVLPPEARLIRLRAVLGVLCVPGMVVQTPVVMAVVLLSAAVYVTISTLLDLSYRAIDPRIGG
jgi:hypothetical protein